MSSSRPVSLTPLDVELLTALSQETSLVRVCQQLKIPRDRGVYRIRRLERAFGQPVLLTRRGGGSGGESRLSPFGWELLRTGARAISVDQGSRPRPLRNANLITGRYARNPVPTVTSPTGPTLQVDFLAREGEVVTCAVDPETVVIADQVFPTSARNALSAEVVRVRPDPSDPVHDRRIVTVRLGTTPWSIAVTRASVDAFRLRPGRKVVLLVKATAIRRVDGPTPGSLPR